MHSGATDFADRIEVFDARVPPFIHQYAPAEIMSGRYDGNWLVE